VRVEVVRERSGSLTHGSTNVEMRIEGVEKERGVTHTKKIKRLVAGGTFFRAWIEE